MKSKFYFYLVLVCCKCIRILLFVEYWVLFLKYWVSVGKINFEYWRRICSGRQIMTAKISPRDKIVLLSKSK